MKVTTTVPSNRHSLSGFKADISRLPATIEHKPSRIGGLIITLFGLLFAAVPLTVIVHALGQAEFDMSLLMLLPFLAAGLLFAGAGLTLFTKRKQFTITTDQVELRQTSIFGQKHWTVPLAEYEGVLYRTETRSGGRSRVRHTVHVLWLWHEDFSKAVQLAETRLERGLREHWENICRTLNVPAVQMDGDEMLKRMPEDLDKSVEELAKEQKVDIGHDAPAPPPPGLQVKDDLRGQEILLGPRALKAVPIVIGGAIGGVFYYVAQAFDDAPEIFGYVGLGFAGLMGLALLWMLLCRYSVLLRRDGVELGWQTPFGMTASKTVPANEIESVTITQHNNADCVQIATDKKQHHFGGETDAASRDWLRNRIRQHLAGHHGSLR